MSQSVDLNAVYRWLAALFGVVAATALLAWTGANATIAGLVFLMLVVWVSTLAGKWLSLSIAVVCALAFDFFFLPPLHTLGLAGVQEWVAMLALVASCVVVNRVAERARRQTRRAEQRREDVERLNELSQEMMLHEDPTGLIRDLPYLLNRVFALDAVILYIGDQDSFFASGSGLPMSAEASLRAVAAGANPAFSATVGFAAIPLMLGLRPIGALGWLPPGRLSPEVATAAGTQVATALTRSIAIESSARLEASRQGEQLRAALIDSLTHELRTPLTSIRVAATTLLEGEGLDDAGRRDLAALVDEEASRLDTIIGEAVEMAEIDAHVVKVQLAQQPPRALLEESVEESKAALAQHRVSIGVEGDDRPAWFDPHLLGRVFRHLLENAARYSPSGSQIRLCSRPNGERLEFSVEDNGPGIDARDMPLIFEKFYRGKKAAGKGTGMGLAIARAILEAHGGGIEAVSTPGQGTRFRFWVPLVEKEPPSGR